MEGSNPFMPQQSGPATFGGTANALARLGRPIPGPFAHFASPIAPYTIPSFAGGPQQAPNPQMFPDQNSSLHSTLASMAAYSFDSLLSANFNNFANLLMMGPNSQNVSLGSLQQPLLGAFCSQQANHSPSPNSTSPSPNYFRRDVSTINNAMTAKLDNSPQHITTPNNNKIVNSRKCKLSLIPSSTIEL